LIGRHLNQGWPYWFVGAIDEVRLSNVVRYTSNFKPVRQFATDANTRALWHMDTTVNGEVPDASGNGFPLQLQGPASLEKDTCYGTPADAVVCGDGKLAPWEVCDDGKGCGPNCPVVGDNKWQKFVKVDVKSPGGGWTPTLADFGAFTGLVPDADDKLVYDFSSPANIVVGLRTWVQVNAQTAIAVKFQHDDGMSVWLNGVKVHAAAGYSSSATTLAFNPGWTKVEYLVHNEGGPIKLSSDIFLSKKVAKMSSQGPLSGN